MSAQISEYSHDHVVILLETHDFENLPEWLTKNFTVIEGGTHAGKFPSSFILILQR
jgi:hypothetical protein